MDIGAGLSATVCPSWSWASLDCNVDWDTSESDIKDKTAIPMRRSEKASV